jgi:hypothetical protein
LKGGGCGCEEGGEANEDEEDDDLEGSHGRRITEVDAIW